VAIGELADGLEIDLDAVLKKYEGLDGTELALSESQERMAVVLDKKDVNTFKQMADEENLEAVEIASVTDDNRLIMVWRNKTIVNISRKFINTHGIRQQTDLVVTAPADKSIYFKQIPIFESRYSGDIKSAWLENLKQLNVGSQRGLIERFDSTIGAGSVLLPFGGKHQQTPTETMVAKIPVIEGTTNTGTVMSYGFNPKISLWSPFHGAVFSVIEAVSKIVASGGEYQTIRVSLQEYFEKLGLDKKRWGKPFSALLGAYVTLTELEIAAIGGKDSMSGSFNELDVPPTLITFAVTTLDVNHVVSPEFKHTNSPVVLLKTCLSPEYLPIYPQLKNNFQRISRLIREKKILASHTITNGGMAAAISKMTFGNRIGFKFEKECDLRSLFKPQYGSFILEIKAGEDPDILFADLNYEKLGFTLSKSIIKLNSLIIDLEEASQSWVSPLESIFPTHAKLPDQTPATRPCHKRGKYKTKTKISKPRVLIPVFPGTNCEFDTAAAFREAGAIVNTLVFQNLTPSHISQSLTRLKEAIDDSQIIALPGGFSAGDEPEGSGKFIAAVFRNPKIKDATMELIKNRDGLILGICNGFQALIKLGLLPFGEISKIHSENPTLTVNSLGRHMSRMVHTQVTSLLSPWFSLCKIGDIHTMPISHGEGRFVANPDVRSNLFKQGLVATQYVDLNGNPTYDISFNPNGSMDAIEGITSPDGRILGKMAHSERKGEFVSQNVPGEKNQKLFESGVRYFS